MSHRLVPALVATLIATAATAGGTVGTTYPVVDSGQEGCFGTGRGARSTCPAAGSPLFGQDGDGTVTDLVSGLMWQRGFSRGVAWEEAAAVAARAATGGHRDWRVPTLKELYSLIDFSGATGRADMMSGNSANAASRSAP